MAAKLTDTERQIIQMMILDRWNPHRLNKKIASHFGLTVNQVRWIRRKPAFQAEHAKQLAIYQHAFDNIGLADRKERVRALDALYYKIPDCRVALKLKVLGQIREEVAGDWQVVEHRHAVQGAEPNASASAATYEEWLAQNRPEGGTT